MNKMKKMMTVAIAAYAAFTAYAGPGTAKKDVGFTTAREAYKAFTASTNDALRIAAYGHVRTLVVAHVDEAAAREELVFLRNMARTLGQEAKCGDVCEIAAGSTNSAVRLVALTWLCDVARGLDADKATALVDKWLAKTDGDVVAQSFLLCRRMEARKKAGDMGGAEDAASAVMSFGADAPWTYYSQACFSRAEVLAKRGDASSAEAMLSRLLERAEVASPGIARRLVAIGIGRELALRFVEAMRRKISDVPVGDLPAFKTRVQGGEAEIVELLVHAGRLEEALGECRVMLLTAVASSVYGNAVRLTADVLKRMDGNLGRASAFLDAQKSNHVVRASSPLPSDPSLADGVRRDEREKCLAYAKEKAADWNAQLTCAYRLLWADCAEDSIRAALDAFALAPFSEKRLQMCADAAMHPFAVMTRDPGKVAIVRDYLLFGNAGRDGVVGTDDDLKHPAELYRMHTFCGSGESK